MFIAGVCCSLNGSGGEGSKIIRSTIDLGGTFNTFGGRNEGESFLECRQDARKGRRRDEYMS